MSRTLRLARYLVRRAGLPERIQTLVKKYPQVSRETIQDLATVDPTRQQGKYLEWLVSRVNKGNLRWPEDRLRVQKALSEYHLMKPREKKQYGVNSDIGRYSFPELVTLLREIYGQEIKNQEFQGPLPPGSSIFFQNSKYTIIRVGGPGTKLKEAIKAACELGEGTEWCTGGDEAARHYLEKGPLYIIYQDGIKIAQTDGDQLMDTLDDEILIKANPALWKILAEVGIFSRGMYAYELSDLGIEISSEEERYLLDDSVYRKAYIRNILHGRWPEAEPLILRDKQPDEIYLYTTRALSSQRWPAGEKALLSVDTSQAANYAAEYATSVIRGRWPEAEPLILRRGGTYTIFYYVKVCFQGKRWPAGEHALLNSSGIEGTGGTDKDWYLSRYAVEILKRRWPEAEPLIIRYSSSFRNYTDGLNLDPKALIEEFIETHGKTKN